MRVIFEHTIRVYSALEPISEMLTPAQFWDELVEQLRHPMRYLEGLENVKITESGEASQRLMLRTKDYGKFKVQETVSFVPHEQIKIAIKASQQWPANQLTIHVQRPKSNGSVFLHFCYEEDSEPMSGQQAQMIAKFREQAYLAKDHDFVEHFREQILRKSPNPLN